MLVPTTSTDLSTSLLAADFALLGEQTSAVAEAGADLIHLDIMDGHFVPNISMGPAIVKAIRGSCDLPFDVHLMISNPSEYIDEFVDAGADHVTIHVESKGDIHSCLEQIRGHGCSTGISLRPGTEASTLTPFLEQVDMILVMTVEPGFGGQSFMTDQLDKIKQLHTAVAAGDRSVHIEVDGGITSEAGPLCTAAGANILVAGTAIFKHPDGIAAAISELRD